MATRKDAPALLRLASSGLLAAVIALSAPLPAAIGVSALLVAGSSASAKEWDSAKDNVIVAIPDAPAPWTWRAFNGQWAKAGIIKGAERVLTTLKRTGDPAHGQGGLMHLAVRPAGEDVTLASAADDEEIRAFLLKRFKGSEGEIEREEVTVDSGSNQDGHPAIVLRTKGKAANLKAKDGPCTGYLLVTLARGKLYLLRMYAFPTEDDDDGLVYDLDYMEANCLRLINTKAKGAKRQPKAGGDADPKDADGGKGDGPAEEEREDEVIENHAQRWRITIDKKLLRLELTDDEKNIDFLELKCEEADRMGGYSFYVYAPPNTQYIDGVKTPPPNLMKWIGPDWWQNFTVNHPKGELATYKWPKKLATKGARTFLTMPYIGNEKARKVVFKEGKKRPVEMSASDMRKAGFFEKVKRNNIGKKGKVSEAVRGVMQGKRPRLPGQETIIRFAFRGRAHSYRVFVSLWGEAHKKWGEALRRTLESWEFGLKFKD